MACTNDTDSVALSIDSGVLEADVKISATAGNRASINPDGVFVAGDFIETGDYVFSGRASKTGFLLADGSAVSRSTFSVLFGVYGTTYGSGDGSTTFNLPDVQGRGLVGKGTHASVSALGANEGVATVANRSPKHNHTVVVTALLDGGNGAGSSANHISSVAGPRIDSLHTDVASAVVGPGGTLPVDTGGFLVGNCFIKT